MSSNHKPLPEFQICPEAARFRSTEHNYPVEIRHINCPGYDEPTSGGRGATPGSSCSCDTLVEILEEPNQWMEVCPGECNETTGVSDSTITVVLHEIARTLYESAHSRTGQSIEVVDTRIIWCPESPIPAYFSPRWGRITPHSSTITSGHLALIQARGFADHIRVDFRTHEPRMVTSNGSAPAPADTIDRQPRSRRHHHEQSSSEKPDRKVSSSWLGRLLSPSSRLQRSPSRSRQPIKSRQAPKKPTQPPR